MYLSRTMHVLQWNFIRYLRCTKVPVDTWMMMMLMALMTILMIMIMPMIWHRPIKWTVYSQHLSCEYAMWMRRLLSLFSFTAAAAAATDAFAAGWIQSICFPVTANRFKYNRFVKTMCACLPAWMPACDSYYCSTNKIENEIFTYILLCEFIYNSATPHRLNLTSRSSSIWSYFRLL